MRATGRATNNTRTTRSRRWYAVPLAAALTAMLTFGASLPAMADSAPLTDAPKSAVAVTPSAGGIAPMASSTTTDIVVRARTVSAPVGTAEPSDLVEKIGSNYAHTVGATYRLYTYTTQNAGPQNPVNEGWATCTISSGGSCTITVPNTDRGGANYDKRFWVVQTAAPAGTYGLSLDMVGNAKNAFFRLGNALGPTTNWFYPGVTEGMRPNATQNLPRFGDAERSNSNKSFGAVANSLNNPTLQPQCSSGLSIALVMDLSTSVSANQRTQFRNAIVGPNGLFDSLMGTNSSIAVVTFGTSSPAAGTSNHLTPIVLNAANRSTLESRIDTSTVGTQYTNWDKALRTVAESSTTYDLVLFITDGAPNYIRSSNTDITSPDGTSVAVRSVEAAIYSANAIKAKETRIIGIGVGNGVGGDVIRNLRATSGPTVNNDYYQTTDWGVLNNDLKKIAEGLTCRVGITVDKTEIDEFGTTTALAGDWTFGATQTAGSGTLSTPASATTAAGSPVEWVHQFTATGQSATVKITETQKPGWAMQDVTCTGATATRDGNAWTVSFTLGASIACTVTNSKISANGSVTKSAATPAQAADGTWSIDYTVTVTNSSSTAAYPYTLNDTLQYGGGFTPGTASVLSSPASGSTLTAGWTGRGANTQLATGIVPANGTHVYTIRVAGTVIADGTQNGTAWKCVSTPNPASAGGFLNRVDLLNGAGAPAGTDYACKEPAFPKVQKSPGTEPTFDAASGAWTVNYTVSVQNPSAQLALQASLADTLPTLPAGWSLDGSWTATPTGGAPAPTNASASASPWTIWSGTLPKNTTYTYTVSAKLIPGVGATPIGACDDGKGGGLVNSATVTSGLVTATDDACVTIDTPPVSITKSDGTATQLANGDWQIDYTITVSNASAIGTLYTLTDTPQLGSGWTLVSGSWQGDAPAANMPIAGGASHEYTYRVTARVTPVDAGTPNPSLVCTTEGENPGGAFYNVATVHYPGGPEAGVSDDGCAVPAAPTVTKTPQAPTQNVAIGNWTLRYTVTVTNPSELALAYTLSDTAAALPVGITPIGDWTVTGPVISGGGTGTVDSAWNGTGVLATGHFPAGATHTYTVQRLVQVAAAVIDSALSCGETSAVDGGFWNVATVTNGVGGNDDDACISISRPDVTVGKTVTGVSQLADDSWQITYQVVATNTSQRLAARYDLSDTLVFGGGITVSSATWTGPSIGTFSGNTATLAANRLLAPAGSDTYTVTVKATIASGTWAGETLLCKDAENPDAGGFLNTVTLTVNGTAKKADDCATPKLPEVTKTGTSVVQDATDPEKWLVSYELTVHPSGFDTFYTLADIPGFAAGVTLGDGTAQRVGTDEVLPITSGGSFPATAVPLGAAETHIWTVTWQATITGAGVTPPADECGQTPAAGEGFYNRVELLQGGTVIDDDDACLPITSRVYPTVTKTVTSVTQGADAQWTVSYDVVVSLAANDKGLSATYNLSDELRFGAGITVTEASWAGETSGTFAGNSATLATGRSIASGATHTYTVTAKANVTAAALTGGTTECLSGETPGAGGFLNSTTLVSGGQTSYDHDCAAPLFPAISKTGQDATQNDDGSWNISYLVTVSVPATDQSPAPPAVVFALTDAPALPDGVELADGAAWSVAGQDDAASDTITAATWDGEGTWQFASGELAPGSFFGYLVSTKVTVLERENGHTFSTCADTDETGISLPNTAVVASGAFSDSDTGCTTVLPAPSWTVSKSSVAPSGSAVRAGDEIVYTISVRNTGQVPVVGAKVIDDLSSVLEHAELQLPLPAGADLSGTVLTWTVPAVPVGDEPVTVSYRVLIDEDAWGVTLRNVITGEGPVPPADCAEGSDPLTQENCFTEHFSPRWELHKDSDPAPGSIILIGSVVTYVLTATNVGPVPVSGAVAIDDMSGVLPYADMHGTLDPALHFDPDAATIVWTLPDLAVGESVQITYQVKVHLDAHGVRIFNVVTPGDPSGSCPVQCETNKRTGMLGSTGFGASVELWLAIALVMMLFGGLFVASRVLPGRRLELAPAGSRRDAAPARRSTYRPVDSREAGGSGSRRR